MACFKQARLCADGRLIPPPIAGHFCADRSRLVCRGVWMDWMMRPVRMGAMLAGAGLAQGIHGPECCGQPANHGQLQQQADHAGPGAMQAEKCSERQQDGKQDAHDRSPDKTPETKRLSSSRLALSWGDGKQAQKPSGQFCPWCVIRWNCSHIGYSRHQGIKVFLPC